MAITINLTLFKRKKRKNGEIPVYIRFTENRKSRYRSTGIAVPEKDWNSEEQEVRRSHRRYKKFNLQLRKLVREVESAADGLELQGALTMEALLREISDDSGEEESKSLLITAKKYRDSLYKEGRYWEHRHFKVVMGNLDSFITETNADDDFKEIDSNWIESFQNYLLNKKDRTGKTVGNNANTVRKKMQRLRGMFKWLVKTKQIQNDPFLTVEKVAPVKGDTKIKLSIEQIQAIENLDLKERSSLWHVRNYFMFSFYNAGIRFGDLCTLQWKNIVDGRLTYKMHKTGGQKSIRQLAPMKKILAYYQDGTEKPEDYIFPILDQQYSDPMQLRRVSNSRNVIVNKQLRKIAELAGIQSRLSFHVSRHSFAHYALKKGMDLYSISKALGHSDLKITQEYIKSFDEELLDKSMQGLFTDA